jgi:hypothetical protein
MASLPEHAAAPNSGNHEISALADIWAGFAVRSALEPDADDILQKYLQLLARKVSAIDTENHDKGRLQQSSDLQG